jgi:hypothetical protein
MIIDEEILEVLLGDGKLVFLDPQLKGFAQMTAVEKVDPEERADLLFSQLLAVENLFYRDGTPVTVESLREKKCSIKFFTQVVLAYYDAIGKRTQAEAEAKKEGSTAA